MAVRLVAALGTFALIASCSGPSHGKQDAAVDAAIDAPGDAGRCGTELFFTGEYVDMDSTDTTFCGIFNATFQVHGDAARVNHTNPNGRFELCLAPAPTTQVDITPATALSECTSPRSTYPAPGIFIANQQVIVSGMINSARAFTAVRAPDFAYDVAKAQVMVHVDGTPRAVSITGTSDAARAWSGSAWAAGTTGINVFFPNVDPAPGTTTISVAGGSIGEGAVPLVAGSFSYLTVIAN